MNIAKLYLIMPPQKGLLAGFATGLLSLKRHLSNVAPQQAVEIVDFSDAEIDDALSLLERLSVPRSANFVIGLTTTTATYQSALSIAKAARSLWGSRAIILFGGPHASADPKTIIETHTGIVDYLIVGEGERAIAEFLQSWPDIERVPGLAFSKKGKFTKSKPPLPLVEAELDQLTLDDEWFSKTGHPGKFDSFTYVSARGCPLSCAFCAVSNQAIRAKSPEVFREEIASIVRRGYRRIAIEDNFFAHSPARTAAVCSALEDLRSELPDFEWDCQTRVEAVARTGTAQRLADAGCSAVYVGVEALAPNALKFLGKAVNEQRYLDLIFNRALPALFDAGLSVHLNIQFGLPREAGIYFEETLARLHQIADLSLSHGSEVTIFPQLFVIYPGTAHSTRFITSNTLWPTVFEDFTKWETKELELTHWMGRYFAHGVGGIPLGLLNRDALENRKFQIEVDRLLEIERRLFELESLSGLNIFSYSSHLVESRSANKAMILEREVS